MNTKKKRPILSGVLAGLATMVVSVILTVGVVLLGPNFSGAASLIQILSMIGSWGAIIVGVVVYMMRRN